MGRQIKALTGIRAFAALAVVFYHYSGFAFGFMGVDLFFVLSGFILTHVHFRDLSTFEVGETSRFYTLRLARIYPVHLFILAGTLIAIIVGQRLGYQPHHPAQWTFSGFISSTLLVQAFWNHHLTWNVPSWSISAEWFAYLFFPLAVLAARALESRGSILMAIAIVATGFVVCVLTAIDPDIGLAGTSGFPALSRVSFEFVLGMLLCRLTHFADLSRVPWTGILAALAVPLIYVGVQYGPTPTVCLSDVGFFALVILSCYYEGHTVARLLACPLFVYVGEISYSLYMVHALLLQSVGRVITTVQKRFALSPYFGLATMICCALVAASVLFHFVEEPARNRLRRVLNLNRRPESKHNVDLPISTKR